MRLGGLHRRDFGENSHKASKKQRGQRNRQGGEGEVIGDTTGGKKGKILFGNFFLVRGKKQPKRETGEKGWGRFSTSEKGGSFTLMGVWGETGLTKGFCLPTF